MTCTNPKKGTYIMTQEEAKKYIKDQLADYLYRQHGIDVSQSKKLFRCLTGRHEDNHPSMSYDRSRNKVRCFSCEEDLDTLDLIQIDQKTDFIGALEYGKRLYNITTENYSKNEGPGYPKTPQLAPSKDIRPQEVEEPRNEPRASFTAYYDRCTKNLHLTDYPERRGISQETCKRFSIGFDTRYKAGYGTWEALIIPTSEATFTARNTDPQAESKDRYRNHGKANLFNLEGLKRSDQAVFIVEGEIDALSIIEAGGEAVALGSTANAPKLVEEIKAGNIGADTFLILMLDQDNAGRKAEAELKAELDRLGVISISDSLPEDYKDPNEFLTKDKSAFKTFIGNAPKNKAEAEELRLKALTQEYEQTSALNDLGSFIKTVRRKVSYYPTGYIHLDHILDGGLYPGLYFIGAISSLGKTTLALQIADQIAEQGQDVLIFSLEMDKNELLAKSISRFTYLLDKDPAKSNAKTTRGVLTGSRYENYNYTELELIKDAIRQYADFAGRIYISIGVGDIGAEDIKQQAVKHKEITGNTPVILIDYLQIIAPVNDRATDKQNTDKAVTELKRISRDLGTPIIGISSFNRDNYNEPVNLASFKESGAIEYSSDVLIGLQYAGMDYQEGETDAARRKRVRELYKDVQSNARDGKPIQIELKVLKNRNGEKGTTLFEFYPRFNYFKNVNDFGGELSPAMQHIRDMLKK